jgi:fimbrial isopeptide formation D2 family protein/uncharacterized repeat protein (TIGR01451 family)
VLLRTGFLIALLGALFALVLGPLNTAGAAPGADLGITVSATDGSGSLDNPKVIAGSGQTFAYSISVTNNGDDPNVGGFTVTDVLPTGLTFADSPGCSATGQTVTCDGGDLAVGAHQDFTINATANADAADSNGYVTSSVQNTASVAPKPTANADPNPANDSASATTTITAQADLQLNSLTASPNATSSPPAIAGNDITYTITVKNGGPSNAGAYTVTAPLPVDTTFSAGSGCVEASGTITCSGDPLSTGNSHDFTATLHTPPGYTGNANSRSLSFSPTIVDPPTTPQPPDSTGNDSQTLTFDVVAQADLAITATATPNGAPPDAHAVAGATTEDYDVTVTNNGPSNSVGGYKVTASLPAGTTFDAASDPSCSVTGVTITCDRTTIGTLAPTGTDEFHIKLDLLASYGNSSETPDATPLTLTVSIDTNSLTRPQTTANSGADSASPNVTVYSEANLTTTKSESTPATLAANTIYANSTAAQNTVTFTVSVSNGGVSDAHNVQINDALDANKLTNAVYCSGASCTPATPYTGSLPVGTLAAGTSATFVVAAQANSTLGHSNGPTGLTGPGPYTHHNTATTVSSTPVHTTDQRTSTPVVDTTIDTVPAPPTIVQFAVAGNTQGAVMWSNAGEGNGGRPITSYTLKACLVSNPNSCQSLLVTNTNPNATFNGQPVFSYIISGLTNASTYRFSVIATNDVGDSDPADAGSAIPSAAAFTSTIPTTGALNADTGFSGGASTCNDPTLITCKNIVGKYSFTDTHDIGSAYNLDAEPNNVLGSSVLGPLTPGTPTLQCLDVKTLDPGAVGFGTVEISSDGCGPSNKVIRATYPIGGSAVPHLEYEQLDASITTYTRGAPCFAYQVDSTGTAQCTNPNFPHIYNDPNTNQLTNFCPAQFPILHSNTGWTVKKQCTFTNYITMDIPHFNICAHQQQDGLCYGVLPRPVPCGPEVPTCGAPVIIGSSVTLGVTESSKLLAPGWCAKNLPTVPCIFKVLWLNNSTSNGNNDVQIQDYQVGDNYKGAGSG